MDSRLISLEDVTYGYPSRGVGKPRAWSPVRHQVADQEENSVPRPALEDVSIDFLRGEYVALLGHNGSGKSTLARLINGLLLPTRGRVQVAGLDTRLPNTRKRIRELIGMIFSDPDNQIIATLVEDDVAWGPAARGWPRDRIRERVDRALLAVGLESVRDRPPATLSGGQRQRLALAGVLALEPDCIVADEPTALLDPLARGEVLALLHNLCRSGGITIIHTTHLLEEAALADRVVALDRGRVVLTGSPREVFSDLSRLRSLRLRVPEIALLGERLRSLGIDIPVEALSPEALVKAWEEQHEIPQRRIL
jgi:energy-coupling factor transport system ATP-binding protein